MQLNDAAVLVTGAGSGLGAATAEALAAAGARVVAMDVNAEGLAALAARCDATLERTRDKATRDFRNA